jgi:pyruvate dehydrogenase E1 component beta subunit
MKRMTFAEAIDDALLSAMEEDERIIVLGEDVPMLRARIFARFGKERVLGTPISEAAFLTAGVGAAMAGLIPVVEIMMVDFIAVAADALLNHAAKVEAFSGGNWKVPLVVRTACGGGYGDGGQHEQSLWGWLSHIPGLAVVVPSNPADAGGLMLAALRYGAPVVYMEHKLLSESWLDFLAFAGRDNIHFWLPEEGMKGDVPDVWEPVPIGKARTVKKGTDLSFIAAGADVYRCLEVARQLEKEGVSAEILDLRTISPLDVESIVTSAQKTGRILVVDEDYKRFGLSGEIAAVLHERNVPCAYRRVCTEETIPYAHNLERETLPNCQRILQAARELLENEGPNRHP